MGAIDCIHGSSLKFHSWHITPLICSYGNARPSTIMHRTTSAMCRPFFVHNSLRHCSVRPQIMQVTRHHVQSCHVCLQRPVFQAQYPGEECVPHSACSASSDRRSNAGSLSAAWGAHVAWSCSPAAIFCRRGWRAAAPPVPLGSAPASARAVPSVAAESCAASCCPSQAHCGLDMPCSTPHFSSLNMSCSLIVTLDARTRCGEGVGRNWLWIAYCRPSELWRGVCGKCTFPV
jgi:hypothetical protein